MASASRSDRAPDFSASDIVSARMGDRDALGRIWSACNPQLLRFLRSLGDNNADDTAATVWVEVARNISRLGDTPHEVRGLLFTIARRRLIDSRRQDRRRAPVDFGSIGEASIPTTEIVTSLDAEALLQRLDPETALLIALRVIAGFSHAEVALAVGKSEGAVRVATHRGLQALREIVAAQQTRESL